MSHPMEDEQSKVVDLDLKVTVSAGLLEGRHNTTEIVDSVKAAIEEALQHAMNRGFNHPLSDCTTIAVNSVEIEGHGFLDPAPIHKVRVYDIEWCMDNDEDEEPEGPDTEMILEIDLDNLPASEGIEDQTLQQAIDFHITDRISNETGWLHYGCKWEFVENEED